MKSPAPDEYEISLFGPGYGESVVLHLGYGEWVIVDSCLNNKTGSVAALSYLDQIKVDISSCVKAIIATHWHDDHIRGLSKTLEESTSAKFFCSNVLNKREFLQFVTVNSAADPSELASSTREILGLLEILKNRDQLPRYVGPDQILYDTGRGAVIRSLSPSNDRFADFLAQLAKLIPEAGETRRRQATLKPNDLAVVLSIKIGDEVLILGADLEEVPGKGWSNILQNSQLLDPSGSFIKVPHHGSKNAHSDEMWTKLLDFQPLAALAPYVRGNLTLPTQDDVDRLVKLAPRSYSTARLGKRAPANRTPAVKQALLESGIEVRLSEPNTGHIQFRRKISASRGDWDVKLHDGATALRRLY